jgi:hypothetical protein
MLRFQIPSRLSQLVLTILLASFTCSAVAVAQEEPMFAPTEEHELLKDDVGTWDADMKVWPMPGSEPLTSKCTETNELLPGGMWAISRFEGNVGGMPFTGCGTFGYDPTEKKYVGTWVDSMTPYLTTMKGDYEPETKTITLIAEGRDPMTGQVQKSKHIGRRIDDNTRMFEIYMPGENGEDWKMLEISYKRRAE